MQTAGDEALDSAASQAISLSSPFPQLPAEFSGPDLALRFHFYYNPTGSSGIVQPPGSPPLPPVAQPESVPVAITTLIGIPVTTGIYTPAPNYPDQAKRHRKQGIVVLSLVVKKSGDVGHGKVTGKVDRDLDSAARDIVKTWLFRAAFVEGKPVEETLITKIAFHIK